MCSSHIAATNMVCQKEDAPAKPGRCLGFFVFKGCSHCERFTIDMGGDNLQSKLFQPRTPDFAASVRSFLHVLAIFSSVFNLFSITASHARSNPIYETSILIICM